MNDLRAGSVPEPEMSRRVLASLMDASPHALLVVDDRCHITNASSEFARWLGLAPSHLVGRPVAEALADLGPGALACWEQVIARVRVDGACREIGAHISPPAVSGPREILRILKERRDTAVALGLTGWVANRYDGSVEVVAEGPREKLDRLLEFLYQGPSMARVDRVQVDFAPATREFKHFTIEI